MYLNWVKIGTKEEQNLLHRLFWHERVSWKRVSNSGHETDTCRNWP